MGLVASQHLGSSWTVRINYVSALAGRFLTTRLPGSLCENFDCEKLLVITAETNQEKHILGAWLYPLIPRADL